MKKGYKVAPSFRARIQGREIYPSAPLDRLVGVYLESLRDHLSPVMLDDNGASEEDGNIKSHV
jgi:hypothetical protein